MAETPLPIDALVAWGKEWQRLLEVGSGDVHIPIPVLRQYLARANEALALLEQREGHAAAKRGGGRPKGTGMGALAAALIDNGTGEDEAVRAIAKIRRKPVDNVRNALRRFRAGNAS